MKRNPFFWVVVVAIFGFLNAGCTATKRARKVTVGPTTLLGVDTALLKKGSKDQALLVYVKPDLDATKYTNMLVDPVIYSKRENISEKDAEQIQKLANNLYGYVIEEFKKDYRIVYQPEPNTVRIQIAIYNPKRRGTIANFATGYIPVGVVFSAIKDFATGKPLAVGEITAEAKLTDATTFELLAAGVDRRVGQKYSSKSFGSWNDVDQAMHHWSKMVRYNACKIIKKTGCIKPE